MENIVELLTPFEEITLGISKATATAADLIPQISALTLCLEKPADSDKGVQTAKATLCESVKRRFRDTGNQPLYVVATLLDPR